MSVQPSPIPCPSCDEGDLLQDQCPNTSKDAPEDQACVYCCGCHEDDREIPPCGDPTCDSRCRECDEQLRQDYLEQRGEEQREEERLWPSL